MSAPGAQDSRSHVQLMNGSRLARTYVCPYVHINTMHGCCFFVSSRSSGLLNTVAPAILGGVLGSIFSHHAHAPAISAPKFTSIDSARGGTGELDGGYTKPLGMSQISLRVAFPQGRNGSSQPDRHVTDPLNDDHVIGLTSPLTNLQNSRTGSLTRWRCLNSILNTGLASF